MNGGLKNVKCYYKGNIGSTPRDLPKRQIPSYTGRFQDYETEPNKLKQVN